MSNTIEAAWLEPIESLPTPAERAALLHAPGVSGGGDVDIVAEGVDPCWALRLGANSRLCQVLRYDVTGTYFVIDLDGRVVALDILEDPRGFGKYRFPAAIEVGEGLSLAPDWMRASYLALKRLRKGIRDPLAWEQIGNLSRQHPDKVEEFLKSALGKSGRQLALAARKGKAPAAEDWKRIRRAQTTRRFRGPRALLLIVSIARRWVLRVSRPTGLWVVIAGPDGAGKTTLADALAKACKGLFRRYTRIHWRPGLLPRRGAVVGCNPGDPTDPHGRLPHPPLTSFVLLIYHWLDFSLGILIRVLAPRARTGLIVHERGWWDIAVDPVRYRLSISSKLARSLGTILWKPDLLLVLDAPAEILITRKRELPMHELNRQRQAWNELSVRGRTQKVSIDASLPQKVVVAAAREAIVKHLERRAIRRLGAGWVSLPSRKEPRWWLPRGPSRVASEGPWIYQPVTSGGRLGWELARRAARTGAFRLVPRGEAPPREVRELLAPYLPPRTTYSVMRANHEGRYVALLLGENGDRRGFAKLATTRHGRTVLERETEALSRYTPQLPNTLRAPTVLASGVGILLMEPVAFQPRTRPWFLPVEVAAALGSFYGKTGMAHGDVAPWNLLRVANGWMLVDWELARPVSDPFFDLFHYLVQAHALLGSPSLENLLAGLEGKGWVGDAIGAYAREAEVSVSEADKHLAHYLRESRNLLDPKKSDGQAEVRARERLMAALGVSP